jgi:nucleoside-diphosphate kinase
MANEACLILIKPDGLVKSLTGNIINQLSRSELKIIGAKVVSVKRELAELHYPTLKEEKVAQFGEEKGMLIYEDVLKYIQGEYHTNRVLAMIYYGEDAITKVRSIAGATNPEKADPTTIRGRYGRIHSETNVFENCMHASDSSESAEREIKLWFKPEEIVEELYPSEDSDKEICDVPKVWK